MENNKEQIPDTKSANLNVNTLKDFYKTSFPGIFKKIFKEPISGAHELFSNYNETNFNHSIILIITSGIAFALFPYFSLPSDYREYTSFGNYVKIGLSCIICLLIISILSFLIKSISGKSDFKKELFTGGLCGISLSLLVFLLFILSLFSNDISNNIASPADILSSGIFVILIVVYIILFTINLFQQSLKASNVNDALSWYISPIAIILSVYLTIKISAGLF